MNTISKITTNFSTLIFKNRNFQRTKLNTLECDTVCFSGKKPRNTLQKLDSVPPECYPSEGLREYLYTEAKKPENKDKSIIDMHREYYSRLEDCKTLDEAKEIYPEFQNTVDLKDTDLSALTKRSILVQINNSEYEGLSLENLSLEMLKISIGRLVPVRKGVNEEYFGLSGGALGGIFDRINIRNNKKYTDIITSERSKESIVSRWRDEESRDKLLAGMRTEEQLQKRSESAKRYYSSEETRKKVSEASKKRWQDPVYREKMLASIQSEENRANMSQKTKANWQNPEYRERMLAIINSEEAIEAKRERQLALWQDPEFRERMTALAQSEEAREFQRERMLSLWQDPEFREKMLASMRTEENRQHTSERMTALWQDPEYREKMSPVAKARVEAWKRHPELRQAYSQVAQKYSILGQVLSRVSLGKGDNIDANYLHKYFKECADTYPDLQKIIGEEQKKILKEWGFNDEEEG